MTGSGDGGRKSEFENGNWKIENRFPLFCYAYLVTAIGHTSEDAGLPSRLRASGRRPLHNRSPDPEIQGRLTQAWRCCLVFQVWFLFPDLNSLPHSHNLLRLTAEPMQKCV
jgi:hypothetical protein